jgi:serine/threonine protein kinase
MIGRSKLLAGKYEVIEPVAKGGMATVWSGYTHGEAGFRRKIAVKRILQNKVTDQEFASMFVHEAHIVAELNHPNIVQVHDFGLDEWGNYFIVMEWVDGLGMEDYIRSFTGAKRMTPWHLISAICIEVLRALTAAHEHLDEFGRRAPIVHRDVNPRNILVGVNGVVKLADFGLARAMSSQRSTDPGVVKGKLAYMAPELLQGDRRADALTDIYSVGVVLWEAAAGQRLFGGKGSSDIEIAERALAAEIPPVIQFRKDLPGDLADVVCRALARDRKKRYQTARSMVEALSAVLRRFPEPADGNALSLSVRQARKLLSENPPGPSVRA